FPLCPSRSPWIRCRRAGAELPATRVAAHAPSVIIHTRSRRCALFWRAGCCGSCLIALFADRLRAERWHLNRLHQCRSAFWNVARYAMPPCATRHDSVSLQPGNAIHPGLLVSAARHYYYFLQTDSTTRVVGPTSGLQYEGKAVWVDHHRSPLPAASGLR